MPFEKSAGKLRIACERVPPRVSGKVSIDVRKIGQQTVANAAGIHSALWVRNLRRRVRADIRPERVRMTNKRSLRVRFQNCGESLNPTVEHLSLGTILEMQEHRN